MRDFLKTEKEIKAWLKQHQIRNYSLIQDEKYGFVVNVAGEVQLYAKGLEHIPIKFNIVEGDFVCSFNGLTTLEFCPEKVGRGFYCDHNYLKSLEFCPKIVGETFNCANNELTTLEFCPQEVGESFNCAGNQLTSLKFCPKTIQGGFNCLDNKLTSLEFCPKTVEWSFYCSYNQLTSLEFCPEKVDKEFVCEKNPLLGEAQNIIDFKKILLIVEKTKLSKIINVKEQNHNKIQKI